MTRKKRQARSRRQLARLGPVYSIALEGEGVVATIDPAVTHGRIRVIEQGRRQLILRELRVKRGKLV